MTFFLQLFRFICIAILLFLFVIPGYHCFTQTKHSAIISKSRPSRVIKISTVSTVLPVPLLSHRDRMLSRAYRSAFRSIEGLQNKPPAMVSCLNVLPMELSTLSGGGSHKNNNTRTAQQRDTKNASTLKLRNLMPDYNHNEDSFPFDASNSNNSNSRRFSDGSRKNNSSTSRNSYPSSSVPFPIGDARADRLLSIPTSSADLTFLGTSSCMPSTTRGVSSMALRHEGNVFLFDCGESSQIQLLKNDLIRANRIRKIFITHSHGDHSFGLPGVLCLIGQSNQQDYSGEPIEPIDIYGPAGLRAMLRAVLQLTYSRVATKYRVHELHDVPLLQGKQPERLPDLETNFDQLQRFGEVLGGRDIYPNAEGHFDLFSEGKVTMKAAAMQHTIPCVGYVWCEEEKKGTMTPNATLIQQIKRNAIALQKLPELEEDHMRVFRQIKALKLGESYTFPDGTQVHANDVLGPTIPGRKVVFMGDTSSGVRMEALARDADVVVHEATNAWFPPTSIVNRKSPTRRAQNFRDHTDDTINHGHSTPQMAGHFAARVGAKRLIMTHFSTRYDGDSTEMSMRIMWDIENMAREGVMAARAMTEGRGNFDKEALKRGSYRCPRKLKSHPVAAALAGAATTDDEAADATTDVDSNGASSLPPITVTTLAGENDVIAAWDHMTIPLPFSVNSRTFSGEDTEISIGKNEVAKIVRPAKHQ